METYTYIFESSDGTYYTGSTNENTQRLLSHNAGKGGKYTRVRRPVKLVYTEIHDTKREAMQRESQIKKLTRKEKEALIQGQA